MKYRHIVAGTLVAGSIAAGTVAVTMPSAQAFTGQAVSVRGDVQHFHDCSTSQRLYAKLISASRKDLSMGLRGPGEYRRKQAKVVYHNMHVNGKCV